MSIQSLATGSQLPNGQSAGIAAELLPVVRGKEAADGVASLQSRAPQTTASAARVKEAAEQLERAVRQTGRNLNFHVDADSGVIVVKVVDAVSGEVIRQIPNEETLRLAKSLAAGNKDVSLIVDERA